MTRKGLILKIDCPDRPGLVAKIAGYASDYRANLVEFNQFTDTVSGRFFARLEIETDGLEVTVDDFVNGFGTLGRALQARWHFRRLPYRMRTAVLVTRTEHCLNEILWRAELGELPVEITSIIGNRDDCRDNAEKAGNPVPPASRSVRIKRGRASAPSRRILSERGCRTGGAGALHADHSRLVVRQPTKGRMINIHHSFLPAFVARIPTGRPMSAG